MRKKTLFFCSHMEPFGEKDLRPSLDAAFGGERFSHRLHIEESNSESGHDARLPCARAIQDCDGVVLFLDGTPSSMEGRGNLDAPVLELEVMFAAASDKPVLVLDASQGRDPLFALLGTEFFGSRGAESRVVPIDGKNSIERRAELKGVLSAVCSGETAAMSALPAGVGWQSLFEARPDRLERFFDDGGNFPFATQGLGVDLDAQSSDIEKLLDEAVRRLDSDKMGAMVIAWDAIRALSARPWAMAHRDTTIALLWLRALRVWGGVTAWLGVFGHSTAASLMAALASRQIASLLDHADTRDGGAFSAHSINGALASNYFSLSKAVPSQQRRRESQTKGIGFATKALAQARDPRAQAGLRALRGTLSMSTRTIPGAIRGYWDLRQSVGLHKKSSKGSDDDLPLAHARIQLGAARKEIAKELLRRRTPLRFAHLVALRFAHSTLKAAHVTLEGSGDAEPGQRLMCMKHLVETLRLIGRETEARDLWIRAIKLARDRGVSDQLRQLTKIGAEQGWEEPVAAARE